MLGCERPALVTDARGARFLRSSFPADYAKDAKTAHLKRSTIVVPPDSFSRLFLRTTVVGSMPRGPKKVGHAEGGGGVAGSNLPLYGSGSKASGFL